MISKINFKNYKGFKSAELDLKPITLLLGANSTGKSSIIQLLLMIAQTVNYDKPYKSALRLNGDLVRLGEFENIFHNKNTSNPIELEIQLPNFSTRRIWQNLKYSIEDIYFSLEKINALLEGKESRTRVSNSVIYKSRSVKHGDTEIYNEFLSELPKIKRKINSKLKNTDPNIAEEIVTRYFRNPRNRRIRDSIYNKSVNKIIITFDHLKCAYSYLNSLESISDESYVLSYRIKLNKKDSKLDVDKLSINTISGQNILTYSYDRVQRGKHHNLTSDFIEEKTLDKYRSKFGNKILFEGLQMKRKNSASNSNEDLFIHNLYAIFYESISNMDSEFDYDKINYVSPLRAFPKRYYFLDDVIVTNSLNSIDGNQLAEVLHENSEIKKKVNNWLENFKLKVSVSQLKDVIHNIRISQAGLNLDITDVGFGLSQILPIIVQGFLSEDNSLTIIEQPEIHLHPRMQAELADLFIDIVKKKSDFEIGKSLLIETHSEYLLKRLRRRMAEGKIDPNDVAIYFIHSRDKENKLPRLKEIKISETGSFDWPSDFYIDDLQDTMAFLKHQK
ncbi:AAA family ATPase [Owenweeksia hongkongensis]|uniref:AAA family ATPase n=1 Tax=Owenweeksia hongkongensis TaxID=253245 RepID=UPI003A9574CB